MAARENPVALACADRVRKADLAALQIDFQNNLQTADIQLLRAAWLARRIALSPPSAAAVLSIYFAEVRP